MLMKIILLLAMTTSCARLVGPGTPIGEGVEVVADCAKDSVKETAKDALTSVEFDMLQDNWKTLLGQQAIKLGEETLACIIDHIINQSRLDKMASADKNARTKVERGEEWMQLRNVRLKKSN